MPDSERIELGYEIWDEALANIGAYGNIDNLSLFPKNDLDSHSSQPIQPPRKSTIEFLSENRPNLRSPAEITPVLDKLLEQMQFKPRHPLGTVISGKVESIEQRLLGVEKRLVRSVGLLVKKVNNKTGEIMLESYEERLQRAAKSGKESAASYGTGFAGEHKIAIYALHYDFMQGTPGPLEGRLYQEASDYAIKHALPFVGIYSSGGIRQHANFSGLAQMTRIVNSVRNFRRKSTQPNFAILIGQDWGGIPASAVGLADYIIGLSGTDHGFTGRRVIKTFTGEDVPTGLQSVEAHSTYRTVEKLEPNPDSVNEHISNILDILTRTGGEKLKLIHLREHKIVEGNSKRFYFGFNGFRFNLDDKLTTSTLASLGEITTHAPAVVTSLSDSELYNRYLMHAKDAARPDMEFYMTHIFGNWARVYDPYNVDKMAHNPSTAAAFGRIGPQPFLVIGNLPSYQLTADGVKKIPASPAPPDFRYLQRMLQVGERYQLPAIFFTDTLGAKPTTDAEQQDQAREIAKSIYAGISYKYPVITCITGALGSGGGLATAPLADYVIALQRAMLFVAEPSSMASILYSKDHPELAEIILTVNTIGATAEDQLKLKLIDKVIPEPMKNGQIDYLYVARRLRLEVVKKYIELQKLSEIQLINQRNRRIRALEGIL